MIEPNRTVTVEPVKPINPSLGPDHPLAFENNVIPLWSNTTISDITGYTDYAQHIPPNSTVLI